MSNVKSNSSYIQSFFIVPFHIINLPGMTLGFLKVYEVIFSFWNNKQPCYIGIQALCERTGLRKRQVYEALKYFIDKKEIIKNRKYYEQPIRILELEDEDDDENSALERTSSALERTKQCAGAHYNNNKLISTNNNKAYRSSDDDVDKIETTFNQFWEAYPKKVAKQDALKAWKKKKLHEQIDKILSDIDVRKSQIWKGKSKQYIPNPATYLNGERWTDEILSNSGANINERPQSKTQTSMSILRDIHERASTEERNSRNENLTQNLGHTDFC